MDIQERIRCKYYLRSNKEESSLENTKLSAEQKSNGDDNAILKEKEKEAPSPSVKDEAMEREQKRNGNGKKRKAKEAEKGKSNAKSQRKRKNEKQKEKEEGNGSGKRLWAKYEERAVKYEERAAKHREAEKVRREKLKAKMDILNVLIPHHNVTNKIAYYGKIIEYIKSLLHELEKSHATIEKMSNGIRTLYDLIPGCDKTTTDVVVMVKEATGYITSLKRQERVENEVSKELFQCGTSEPMNPNLGHPFPNRVPHETEIPTYQALSPSIPMLQPLSPIPELFPELFQCGTSEPMNPNLGHPFPNRVPHETEIPTYQGPQIPMYQPLSPIPMYEPLSPPIGPFGDVGASQSSDSNGHEAWTKNQFWYGS